MKEAGLQDEFKLNLKSLYCLVTNGEGESEEVLHWIGVRQRRVGRSTVGRERLYSVRMDKIYLVSGLLGRPGVSVNPSFTKLFKSSLCRFLRSYHKDFI